MASSIPQDGAQLAGSGQQHWNARVQRDEVLDGRTRIVGYRFRVVPIDESAVAPGPEAKIRALKNDSLATFAQQRLAIVPVSVDEWRSFDFRQFATHNAMFHLGLVPDDGGAARWLHAIEDIRSCGARVALDWALVESDLGELLARADAIFIRPSDYSAGRLGEVIAGVRERYPGANIAADGVGSWTEYRACLNLGVHYCLGGFTATPYQEDETQRLAVLDNVLDNKLVQFYWYRVFECGREEIDHDHQALFGLATDLLNAIISGRSAPKIEELVDGLLARAAAHFAQEEALLQAAGYTNLERHAAIHRQLADKAAHLVTEFKAGRADIGTVFQFLAQDLIVNHMLGADRDFFPLFLRSGLAQVKPAAARTGAKTATPPLPPPAGSAMGARLM